MSDYKGGMGGMDMKALSGLGAGSESTKVGGKRRHSGKMRRSGKRTLGKKYKNKNCGKTRRRRRTRSRMGGLFD